MRTVTFAISLLCAALIGAIISASLVRSRPKAPPALPKLNGTWVSMRWYQGYILAIKGDEFKYWAYSDVITGREPKYPITGKVGSDGTRLHLVPNSIADRHLVGTWWYAIPCKGELCLWSESDVRAYLNDKPLPINGFPGTLLRKTENFDESDPFADVARQPIVSR